jgi:hypothetical protein
MLSIDSAHPQKVDGMHRNRWTAYSGFGGRLAPESVVAIDRITHTQEKLSLAMFLAIK